MKVNIVLKSISNTRGVKSVLYNINDDISNLRELIINLVEIEINNYLNSEVSCLSEVEIDDMLKLGKVFFGDKYREC